MGHYCTRAKVRKRRKAQLATNSRKYTVNNCTIKKSSIKNEILENGNGKVGFNKADIWYKELRKERKEYLSKTFPLKVIVTSNGHKKTIKSKRPWYILQKGENIHKEPKKHGSAWYFEALVQHKIKKWEKKNPRPIVEDSKQKDLFEEQYIPQWEDAREKALERIRDFVVSVYDKLDVVGNKVDYKNGKIIGNVVAQVKDIDQKGHDVLYPNLKQSDPLYKEALNAAKKAMKKDSKIIDCDLQNHKKNQKRPLYKVA